MVAPLPLFVHQKNKKAKMEAKVHSSSVVLQTFVFFVTLVI